MRIGVAVPISGTVARLREAVSSETKIPTEQVMGWAAHLCALPAVGGREEAFVPCRIRRNRNSLPMVEQGSKAVVEIWIMLFPVHWLFES